jgi:hypothetical protein
MAMDVELLYFDGCPHWRTADERVRQVATEIGATVHRRLVTAGDVDQAEGFAGSPTILVDGWDPFPATPTRGLGCRLYATPQGTAGSPTIGQLRAALHGQEPAPSPAPTGEDTSA